MYFFKLEIQILFVTLLISVVKTLMNLNKLKEIAQTKVYVLFFANMLTCRIIEVFPQNLLFCPLLPNKEH